MLKGFIGFVLLIGMVRGQQSITLKNVVVNFLNRGQQTDFFLISNLAPGIDANNAWLGVGVNSIDKMVIYTNQFYVGGICFF